MNIESFECPEKRCVLSIFMACSSLQMLENCSPKCRKCHYWESRFQNFLGKNAPEPSTNSRAFGARPYQLSYNSHPPPWKTPISAPESPYMIKLTWHFCISTATFLYNKWRPTCFIAKRFGVNCCPRQLYIFTFCLVWRCQWFHLKWGYGYRSSL